MTASAASSRRSFRTLKSGRPTRGFALPDGADSGKRSPNAADLSARGRLRPALHAQRTRSKRSADSNAPARRAARHRSKGLAAETVATDPRRIRPGHGESTTRADPHAGRANSDCQSATATATAQVSAGRPQQSPRPSSRCSPAATPGRAAASSRRPASQDCTPRSATRRPPRYRRALRAAATAIAAAHSPGAGDPRWGGRLSAPRSNCDSEIKSWWLDGRPGPLHQPVRGGDRPCRGGRRGQPR